MDDLFGFLFGAAIVITIIYVAAMFAAMLLVNLYVLLDPVLAGFGVLPAPWAWAVTSGIFVALLHFACAESPSLRRPGLGKAATVAALCWLGLAAAVGLTGEPEQVRDRYARSPPTDSSTARRTPRQMPAPPSRPQARPAQTERGLNQPAYVDTQKLNIRKGPGTEFAVVGTLTEGTILRISARQLARDGRPWVHIHTGTAEGWVSERYLAPGVPKPKPRTSRPVVSDTVGKIGAGRPQPALDSSLPVVKPTRSSLIQRPGKPFPTAHVQARHLDLRQGPGSGYPSVARVSKGALIQMKARQRGVDGRFWVFVRSGSKEGWGGEHELPFSTSTGEIRTRAGGEALTSPAWARVATKLLNVRAGPGVGNGIVGRIARGTRVRVSERRRAEDDATWVRIQSDAVYGWVNAKFLETAP